MLLENERGEWELPGGKLEPGESPEECVAREIREELDLRVEVGPLLDAWLYEVLEGIEVFVVAYGCYVRDLAGMSHSEEHSAVGSFDLNGLDRINLPDGYKRSIKSWTDHPANLSADR